MGGVTLVHRCVHSSGESLSCCNNSLSAIVDVGADPGCRPRVPTMWLHWPAALAASKPQPLSQEAHICIRSGGGWWKREIIQDSGNECQMRAYLEEYEAPYYSLNADRGLLPWMFTGHIADWLSAIDPWLYIQVQKCHRFVRVIAMFMMLVHRDPYPPPELHIWQCSNSLLPKYWKARMVKIVFTSLHYHSVTLKVGNCGSVAWDFQVNTYLHFYLVLKYVTVGVMPPLFKKLVEIHLM